MKRRERFFATFLGVLAASLSLGVGVLDARDGDLAPGTMAAARTTKQQCINTCRARYRDCRRMNQLPWFECQGIQQDCMRYTCTGLGPG
jgi:hypothetical protein